jgi:hypothetical protein
MENLEFYDMLYQGWSKTTGAENRFWMPDKDADHIGRGAYDIYAVDEQQHKKLVASFLSDEDAAFITAVHGCLPDLIRTLRDAADENDRLDTEKDELIGRVAELELEVDKLNESVVIYLERIKEQESFMEYLANENKHLERWADNGGPSE